MVLYPRVISIKSSAVLCCAAEHTAEPAILSTLLATDQSNTHTHVCTHTHTHTMQIIPRYTHCANNWW